MKRNGRIISALILLSLILSILSPASSVKADDVFQSPDADGDGLSNDMETAGWYNLSGGPYVTDARNPDSDHDGLTDGEEKLFNTNPLDAHDPGIAVKYDASFKTREYFSVTDPAYISIKQGGDRYLMTEAAVVRRGTTFNISGPASATLTIAGSGLTTLTPTRDPARGGWNVSIPANGTVGAYTATVTDGSWSKSMPIYVIFELPSDLSQDQIAAFLYDDDPANLKDEVAVIWRTPEWSYYGNWQNTPQPCPGTDPNTPCSNWQYHSAQGYAQAFWTEQFKKTVLVTYAIPTIQGTTSPQNAAYALAQTADREFRTNYAGIQNSWSSAMYRWSDGTGVTMWGGGCESNAGVYTSLLRSAGIAARPFTLDYNKTYGHGEGGEIGNGYEYDHSVMMWLNSTWYALRSYNGQEGKYYPWTSGTTGIVQLKSWPGYTGYYTDYFGDVIISANAGWDFQNGSNGGGMVNTVWPFNMSAEETTINRDYEWDSQYPLTITQSPFVDILNCQLWQGDNWAPSEWQSPPVSNPAGRGARLTYSLPTGIPSSSNPLENWPYDPQPTACSASTSTAACDAFKASWVAACPAIAGSSQASTLQSSKSSDFKLFLPLITNVDSSSNASIKLGGIVGDSAIDQDGDGRFDQLIVKFEVTSSQAGKYQLGGLLQSGDKEIRADANTINLIEGTQTVQVAFDGQQIGDNQVDGPYQVEALWIARPDQPILQLVQPEKMLDYRTYTYATQPYQANSFKVQAAALTDVYSYLGVDNNGDGLYEAIVVNVSFKITIPGTYQVEGDLYDGQGNFVGHATWKGGDPVASLKFDVTGTQPPYTLGNLNLIDANGPLLDSRYYQAYQINDLEGKIEKGSVSLGTSAAGMEPLSVTPTNIFTVLPIDTNTNGRYDKLDVNVGVTVTDHGGDYRIEGLLENEHGTPVAWSTSAPQTLSVGSQHMVLEFDGKAIFDQMPLAPGTQALKLVAVKIFSGNLSSATLESEAPIAVTTPAYTRSQFEPSSPAVILFQDDMESGAAKWTTSSLWSLDTSEWKSWSHVWKASASTTSSGSLMLASPLDLTNYTNPVLQFNAAYRMGATEEVDLQASTDGNHWTTVAPYTGTTPNWSTVQVDLNAYRKMPIVWLRFNAQAKSPSSLLFFLDDVYLNAWPAVTSADFAPTTVYVNTDTTFTGSYTSIATMPVTYAWDFGDSTTVPPSTSPSVIHNFTAVGDYTVKLTVQNPYDSTDTVVITHTVHVITAQVTVTVTNAIGGVLSGVTVWSYNGSGWAKQQTNGSGQAVFQLTAGSYRFAAVVNEVAYWSGASFTCTIPGCSSDAVTVPVVPVTVTVTNAIGVVQSGVPVWSYNGSGWASQQTNESGQAVFQLLAGSYRFAAVVNDVGYWSGASFTCTIPGCVSDTVVVGP